jgi:CBS domain-containing protein
MHKAQATNRLGGRDPQHQGARHRARMRPRDPRLRPGHGGPGAGRPRGPGQADTPTPLVVERAIERAQSFEQLSELAAGLGKSIVSLTDTGAGPGPTSAHLSALADSLTRRSIQLSISELGPPPGQLSWLALGSHGRGEAVPGSDLDSALAWDGDEANVEAMSYMRSLGSRVCEALARCGFAADERGASAAHDLFVRPLGGWRRLIREAIAEPTKAKGLIVISLFLDGRVVRDGGGASELQQELLEAHRRPGLLRLMLRLALAHKPAVGSLRGLAVERSGEHRGRLDIKHRGLLPITSIARYAGLAAGAIGLRATQERLSAAAAEGTLDGESAGSLSEAFELFQRLRLEHQVEQIKSGSGPDDYLDPKALGDERRSVLRDALREVRAAQRKLGGRLSGELAFA